MQKITPFIWFDEKAEEAAHFYVSVFPHSKIVNVTRFAESGKEIHRHEPGSTMTVEFELEGQRFMLINGGPGVFKLTGAISFIINCKTQEEVDHYWEKLSAVPQAEQCGWCTDKYGVTWQVVPDVLDELMGSKDRAKAERATAAMMQMKKLDIEALRRAYNS